MAAEVKPEVERLTAKIEVATERRDQVQFGDDLCTIELLDNGRCRLTCEHAAPLDVEAFERAKQYVNGIYDANPNATLRVSFWLEDGTLVELP